MPRPAGSIGRPDQQFQHLQQARLHPLTQGEAAVVGELVTSAADTARGQDGAFAPFQTFIPSAIRVPRVCGAGQNVLDGANAPSDRETTEGHKS